MNRKEFEKKCIDAELHDYQFCKIEDLENILSIDIKEIEGYTRLTKADKESCNNFLINYINSLGIDNKIAFKPHKVYRCIQKNISVNNYRIAEEYINKASNEIMDSWTDDSNEIGEKIITETEYLRIDCRLGNNVEWLHITVNGTEWY